MKKHNYASFFYLFVILIIAFSCSTNKDAFLNRTYHSTTARYNGYFNANELINQSINSFRSSYKEDYYNLIPIERNPNKEEVEALLPSLDTAISKCKKVIQNHSMPSIQRSYKKVEYNSWIDENFITIGVASYLKRDFETAQKNFKYISKFYANDPSNYIGTVWEAKIDIESGLYTEAGFKLKEMDQVIRDQENREKSKPKKKLFKKKKKGGSNEPAKFPKKLYVELEKTKAELALRKKDFKQSIKHLEKAIEYCKKRKNKSRLHFVIAQLSEQTGKKNKAQQNYTKCLKYPAPYAMHFNARLRRAFCGGGKSIKKELNKMLKDAKNAPYLDQIYYALSAIELGEGNKDKAIELLTKSAFYSTTNKRQKAMAYEKLGDISYESKKYVPAQKYYDSCTRFMPETYPNGEFVQNKAEKLDKLVQAVEIINFEDSVQMIAGLDERERIVFVEDVIEQLKDREKRKKEMEAAKLIALQEIQNNASQNSSNGNKWYFNNPKSKKEGLIDFKKMWGVRENKDDWRRSEKMPTIEDFETEAEDSSNLVTETEGEKESKNDSLSVENLLKNIPLTQIEMDSSIERLLNACFTAAVIYKDQLNEPELATELLQKIYQKNLIHPIDLRASFQLYKIFEKRSSASSFKDHILSIYPESDYASFLKDPDFYLKRQSNQDIAIKSYLDLLKQYRQKKYKNIIASIENLLKQDSTIAFKEKYLLLKVTAKAQITKDKKQLLPELNNLVLLYKNSPEATRAEEMIAIINNGYSKNVPFEKAKSPYTYDEKEKLYALVVLKEKMRGKDAKIKISYFNSKKFKSLRLKITPLVLSEKEDLLLLKEFKTLKKGNEYILTFKKSKRELQKYIDASIYLISNNNLKILLEKKDLKEYESFHEENY